MNPEYIARIQRGCAFIPCYIRGRGKATKIYFKDGGHECLDYSVSKVIGDYCAINMRSIQAIKRACQNITGKKSIVPLYIKEDSLFMPIKSIKPFTRGDKCIGYINIKYMEDIDFDASVISLPGGEKINYLDSSETIKRRLGDCTIINQKMEK